MCWAIGGTLFLFYIIWMMYEIRRAPLIGGESEDEHERR